jgi:nucleotide-binding universal stress UspA family protein
MTKRALLVAHAIGLGGGHRSAARALEAEHEATESARGMVQTWADLAVRRHPELTVTCRVEPGDAASFLLDLGRAATLVVVGSRRTEGFRHHGSVSLSVARHATCPVVVVRPPGHRAPRPLRDRVVLGVDGTVTSRDAAGFAFEYADLSGLPLTIVHGSWERLSRGSSVMGLLAYSEGRGLSDEEELAIAETIAGLPELHPGVEFHEVHRSADPADALIEASEEARLVVVGSRRVSAARALVLRSVSTSLVLHAHSPVAVVHTEP